MNTASSERDGRSVPYRRVVKCHRCRNHGLEVPVKGHKQACRFAQCQCRLCILVEQRRKVMAKQVALRRAIHEDQIRTPDNDTHRVLDDTHRVLDDTHRVLDYTHRVLDDTHRVFADTPHYASPLYWYPEQPPSLSFPDFTRGNLSVSVESNDLEETNSDNTGISESPPSDFTRGNLYVSVESNDLEETNSDNTGIAESPPSDFTRGNLSVSEESNDLEEANSDSTGIAESPEFDFTRGNLSVSEESNDVEEANSDITEIAESPVFHSLFLTCASIFAQCKREAFNKFYEANPDNIRSGVPAPSGSISDNSSQNDSSVVPNSLEESNSDNAATVVPASPGRPSSNECSICCEEEIDCALYPCGHTLMCYKCSFNVLTTRNLCPFCRKPIQDILKLYK